MDISISGAAPPPAAQPAVQMSGGRGDKPGGDSSAPLDFGPAAVFTPASVDQAAAIQMYNSTGNSVALTQWLRNAATLPASGVTVPVVE